MRSRARVVARPDDSSLASPPARDVFPFPELTSPAFAPPRDARAHRDVVPPPPFPRPPAEMHGGRAPPASSAGGAASSPSPLANPASHSAPHRAMNAPSATTPTSVASAASDAAGPPRASLDASLASSDDLGVALASVRSELDEMRRARRSADASLEARLGEALPTLKDLVANEMRAEMDAAVAREVRAALERERRGGDPLERPLVDLGGVSGEPSERTAGDEKGGGSSVATTRATLDEARVEALAEAKCMAIITAQIVPRVGESLRKLDARLTAAEAAVREGSAAVRDRQPTPSASASPPLDAVRADLDELRVRVAALADASATPAPADPSAASTSFGDVRGARGRSPRR